MARALVEFQEDLRLPVRRRSAARRVRIRWRRLASVALAAYILFGFLHQEYRIFRLAREAKNLRAGIAVMEQKNDSLRAEMAYFESDAYVEQAAREMLGLVRVGEVPYRVVMSGEASQAEPLPVSGR